MSPHEWLADYMASVEGEARSALHDEMADRFMTELNEAGFVIVTRAPTKAIKDAWREAQNGPKGPVKMWSALVTAGMNA